MKTRAIEEVLQYLQQSRITVDNLKCELDKTIQDQIKQIITCYSLVLTPTEAKRQTFLKRTKFKLEQKENLKLVAVSI